MSRTCLAFLFTVLLSSMSAWNVGFADDAKPVTEEKPAAEKSEQGWKPLFPKEGLDGWKVTNFGGEGEVSRNGDEVVIAQGVDLSGITSTRTDLPKVNYEIEFEAQRAIGNDFFAGLTFPVKDSHVSLICGGWGGGLCGISSIDGNDASENSTTSFLEFEKGQWYKVRIRVTPEKIEAWLDGKSLVDVEITDRKLDVRFEVEPSKPLGFSTYQTTAHLRNARIRTLPTPAPAK
ncbi:MAG: DUF1080 domain-containing protein [Planctomycetaceae bacterium]